MTKEGIIEKTVKTLSALPAEKAEEVADFAEYILKKHEEYILQEGIQQLTAGSKAFSFMNDEEDLYTADDIIKKY